MALPNTALATGAGLQFVPPQGAGLGLPTESFAVIALGTFTANGASSVTVTDAGVTASSIIIPTLATVGGTVGALPAVKTITPGTGFTVAATASDTSIYNYLRIG